MPTPGAPMSWSNLLGRELPSPPHFGVSRPLSIPFDGDSPPYGAGAMTRTSYCISTAHVHVAWAQKSLRARRIVASLLYDNAHAHATTDEADAVNRQAQRVSCQRLLNILEQHAPNSRLP